MSGDRGMPMIVAGGAGYFDRAAIALLRERLGRIVLRAGWAGGVGVALLVVAAVFSQVTDTATEERRAALASERARLLRGEVRREPEVNERERLKAFYQRFPVATDLPEVLRRLHEHATARGVSLQRTDYRSSAEAGTPLLQVTLTIPVNGEFANLYGWLAEVLREMPEVALETLNVKRPAANSTVVEAEVRLQLYLRGRS